MVLIYDKKGGNRFAPVLEITTLPLDIVEYYGVAGKVNYEDRVSGSGGGRMVSREGLFGEVNSDIPKWEIKSQRITHDDRRALLSVVTGGQRHLVTFELAAMDVFNALIPEKNYETLALKAKAPEQEAPASRPTIPEQIEHLARLKEQGILTPEEFADAKKALLAELMGKS